ncbi:hypothetical protein CsSME_00039598 [Camellia sinensis var. sinensis]
MHGKVEEVRALLSKEFLDSFTEDENKEVVQGEKGKILLCLYEDRDRMIEVTLPWENWDSTSKVIEDGNYMILENRVSILEALLSKYGDLSKSSRLGTKATMSFTMTVCEAAHDMCSTKIRDITTSQFLIWLLSFTLAQYAGFEIQFVIACLTKLVRTHFGLQADDDIRIELELAKMGLTIMKLDDAIEDLKKKKQALLKLQEDRCLRKEFLINVLELERQMAGASLL